MQPMNDYLSIINAVRICNSVTGIYKGITTAGGSRELHLQWPEETGKPEDIYTFLNLQYPKFFKMDTLCKWVFIAAESLLKQEDGNLYERIDKTKIAVVLQTHDGCLEADRNYLKSVESIPSPAQFVYTLPNVMLGEISIRHGFKGGQTCLVHDEFNAEELCFCVNEMMNKKETEACLCGWANVRGSEYDVCLYWIQKSTNGVPFNGHNLISFYKQQQETTL